MDTRAAGRTAAEVEEVISIIKSRMPETYKSVQVKAKELGKDAFALVRRGIRGEPGCFWAFERGHVVGTPFNDQEVTRDVAQLMVQFGCTHVCIWARPGGEGASGAH